MATSVGLSAANSDAWLKTVGINDVISVGHSLPAVFSIDVSGLTSGIYSDKLQVYIAFPSYQLAAELPVMINVIDAAGIAIDKNEIAFGEQFVSHPASQPVTIKNNGVLPLNISQITSSNPAFTISIAAPLTLAPGATASGQVTFVASEEGDRQGTITIVSNDPDDASEVLNVSGVAVGIPSLATSTTSLTSTLDVNEIESQSFLLRNPGFSTLKWDAQIQQTSHPGDTQLPSAQEQFTLMASTSQPIISPVIDPSNGVMYAHDAYKNYLNKYSFSNDKWPDLGSGEPPRRGGNLILDSRLYVVYADNSSTISVYTFPFFEWSTIPNQLGAPTANITTDGSLLYLAGGGFFKSYNPKTKVWKTLSIPSINLNGTGGLTYFDGAIYAHEGGGTGFAVYTILTGTWETLPSLLSNALLGSTIDTTRKRYYAYGGRTFFEYDIAAKSWTPYIIPFFEAGDGGMVYVSGTYEGVYFVQGSTGNGFAKFTPTDGTKWLRVAPLVSDIPESEQSLIAVNFNATNLHEGIYKGNIHLTANDPAHSTVDVPVTFNVTYPFPIISTTLLTDMKIRSSGFFNYKLPIYNDGRQDLTWSIDGVLPQALTMAKTQGIIPGYSSEEIPMTFDVTKIPGSLNFVLTINSNDPRNPVVKSEYKIKLNQKPVVWHPIETQNLVSGPGIVQLSTAFADPDGDPLTYTAASSNTSVLTTSVAGAYLTITPKGSGTVVVTLTASDPFDSATTTFTVQVGDVTGLEPDIASTFTSSPNPFEKNIVVRYGVDQPMLSEVLLIDVSGRIVLRSGTIQEQHGKNEIHLDGGNLSAGIYYCALLRNGTQVHASRIVRR
jgi:hypothetical protein